MTRSTISFGKIVLQAALAAVLITAGLSVFTGGLTDEMIKGIKGIFGNNDIRNAVMYVLAIIEIVAGVLLILDFFNIKSLDRFDDLALLIVIIAWCVFIAMADILPLINGRIKFMPWLASLAQHALVLASLIIVKEKV